MPKSIRFPRTFRRILRRLAEYAIGRAPMFAISVEITGRASNDWLVGSGVGVSFVGGGAIPRARQSEAFLIYTPFPVWSMWLEPSVHPITRLYDHWTRLTKTMVLQ